MKNLIRCKVCGYVMEQGKLRDVCPACGVPNKAFEPYKSKMSDKRYQFLSLHIHPIVLHLPQAFVIAGLVLVGLAMVTAGELQAYFVTIAKFNLVLLPVCALAGMASGILDGKMRFKKLSTPALRLKILLASVFTALSIADAVLMLLLPSTFPVLLALFAITAAALGCAMVLGKIGSGLFESAMPG